MEIQDVRRRILKAWITRTHAGNVTRFAADSKLSQAHLSEILRGKRPLGERFARKIELAAKMPADTLVRPSGGVKEPTASYHGISLTRAGALLGAEWEKLDIDQRIEFEQDIYTAVAKKARAARKAQPARGAEDDE